MIDGLKKSFLWLAILTGILAANGAIYAVLGHSFIQTIYLGRAWAPLNRLISGQAERGLDYYFWLGDQYVIWYSILIFLTALLAMPLARFLWVWRSRAFFSPGKIYAGASVGLGFLFLFSALFHPPAMSNLGADYWEHAAVIKEWMSNLRSPLEPILSLASPSVRFIPSYLLIAGAARVAGLDSFQALGVGGLFNLAFLMTGIFLFSKTYFRSEWAPVWGLCVFLTSWGAVQSYSGIYQLRSLLEIISYPSVFAFALTLIVLWMAVRILRRSIKPLWGCLTLAALVPLTLITHVTTGVFALLTIFLVSIFEPGAKRWTRLGTILSATSGLLFLSVWPFFPFWEMVQEILARQKNWRDLPTSFYRLKEVIALLGPALLGLPALVWAAVKKKNGFLISGFMGMVILLTISVVFSIPTGERFLIFAVFFLHLAIIGAILEWHPETATRPSSSRIGLPLHKGYLWILAIFFGCNIGIAGLELMSIPVGLIPPIPYRQAEYQNSRRIISDLKQLSPHIPPQAVVMAPRNLAFLLPAFSGKVVASPRGGYFLSYEERGRRLLDNDEVFSAQTPGQKRGEILKRYQVDYLLFDRNQAPPNLTRKLLKLGCPIGDSQKLLLIKLTTARNPGHS